MQAIYYFQHRLASLYVWLFGLYFQQFISGIFIVEIRNKKSNGVFLFFLLQHRNVSISRKRQLFLRKHITEKYHRLGSMT